MKVWELIKVLKTMDQRLPVMSMADEFSIFYDTPKPEVVELVKGNMFFSHNGKEWVEDDGDLIGRKKPIVVTERKTAIRI